MGPLAKLATEEADRLSEELSALAKKQYEALQKKSYVNMSEAEADGYDKRRLRIGEICDILAKFRIR